MLCSTSGLVVKICLASAGSDTRMALPKTGIVTVTDLPTVLVSHMTVRRREAMNANAPSDLGSRDDGGSFGAPPTCVGAVVISVIETSPRWPGTAVYQLLAVYGTLPYQALTREGE